MPGLACVHQTYLKLAIGDLVVSAKNSQVSSEQSRLDVVLLVEDDAILRGILAQTLTDEGYRVLTAEDGEQALALASSLAGQLALVVTDVLLPEMDGLDLAAHLSSLESPPSVLFISGIRERREMPGPVLAKPFGPFAFLEQVARLLPAGKQQ
jgi:two-component system cell cycle sensor histidine kinase/response regulator CckA